MRIARHNRGLATALLVAAPLLPRAAAAEDRPTEGGPWSFDPSDVVESWEERSQSVRVHYSVDGPNATRLDDLDEDGVPDYAQDVAERTAEAISLYASLGFRAPLPESAIETELGGSPAHDVYLIDFGGAADGRFAIDGCGNAGCAGFYVIENDFAGYGYATIEEGITTVSSHEAFHGVQAAYGVLPDWISEGTATWAQRVFDPASADFIRLCNGLLRDPGRPLYQPPGGPVPAFAYGTALWFDFLSERHGIEVVIDLLEALESGEDAPQLELEALLAARDDDLETAWATFARYNLATGPRAGVAQSHPYAGLLEGIDPDAEGHPIALDARFYPLAANYYNLHHPGGDAWFVADAALPGVAFSLHPVGNFEDDGAVGEPISTWFVDAPGEQVIYEDLPAGGYWVVGAMSVLAEGPSRANVCLGDDPVHPACPPVPIAETSSTSGGTGGDTSGGDESSETSGYPEPAPELGSSSGESSAGEAPGSSEGCGCQSAPRGSAWMLLALVGLIRRRRR